MKYTVLLIALLWAFVGRSQGTIESCREMGLYFCTECSNTDLQCQSCSSGYTLKSDKTGCLICPVDNCKTCTDGTCNDCVDNFYYNGSSCNVCPNNCATCSIATTTPIKLDCDTCLSQFTLNETACVACPTNCLTSIVESADTVCDTCEDGYYIDSDKVCQSTPTFGTGCLEAAYKPPSCSSCLEGVGAELVSGKCYISCYTCGSLTDNVPTSTVAECNAQGNEYLNQTCEYGCSIAIKYDNNEMIFASRGCVVNATCLSDGVEQCTDTGPSQVILVE
ncbi:hypothetical protein LSH36_2403g00013 [Paralvinella palmiformis]|uniref:Uncharacterized protein n=1 Tax=Paralvinella palmiformis TaxID=53620 RepID=A0AAD9IRP0_9ANNE|nr:hypothetical protein LSH36_2403g00013 [Paralvinella palmiformis]